MSSSSRQMSLPRVSSNMDELIFLLKELRNPDFKIQINQVYRMGELIHQSPQQTIEVPRWTATHSNIQIGVRPITTGHYRAKYEHIPAPLCLADLYRPGYIGAVLIGNPFRRYCHILPPCFPAVCRP